MKQGVLGHRPLSCASLPRNSLTPSDAVGPASTAFTVTAPPFGGLGPRDTASCAVSLGSFCNRSPGFALKCQQSPSDRSTMGRIVAELPAQWLAAQAIVLIHDLEDIGPPWEHGGRSNYTSVEALCSAAVSENPCMTLSGIQVYIGSPD